MIPLWGDLGSYSFSLGLNGFNPDSFHITKICIKITLKYKITHRCVGYCLCSDTTFPVMNVTNVQKMMLKSKQKQKNYTPGPTFRESPPNKTAVPQLYHTIVLYKC